MNKIKGYVFASGVILALALAMVFAVPQTKAAEYPNILTSSDMTLGSTGQGVVVLQGLLSELGFLNVPMGIPLGYYGTMTKTALARYQASLGVTPAVGYFGPVTKIAMHADFAPHGWLAMLGW
jgi:peptidoglycan hydrolase-like protein with peptidoglycan-binding domain